MAEFDIRDLDQVRQFIVAQINDELDARADRIAELEAEVSRLQKILCDPVESFGTPELIAWADRLQEILAEWPEEERGDLSFVLIMGSHLKKFVDSWNDPRIAELEEDRDTLKLQLLVQRDRHMREDIESRDEVSRLQKRIDALEKALRAVIEGNDLAAERGHSIESWPGSAIRREAIAVLYQKGDAPKEERCHVWGGDVSRRKLPEFAPTGNAGDPGAR